MKILLATDGSEQSSHACQFLQNGLFSTKSEVHLLHVFEPVSLFNPLSPEVSLPSYLEYHQTAREHGGKLLQKTKELLHAFPHVETVFLEGDPVAQILTYATQQKIDLIVVGSRGLNPMQQWFLGGISSQVVRHADCAVLIYRDGGETVHKSGSLRVVAGFDDSESARHSLEFFLSSFEPSAIEKLDIVTVMELAYHYGITNTTLLEEAWESMKEETKKTLSATKTRCEAVLSPGKVHASILEEPGDISHGLLDFCKRRHTDLLVIGKKGKGFLEKMIIGSVTERLLHHAHKEGLVPLI
jgi:nucleotide-binding universal stress UspA family protein